MRDHEVSADVMSAGLESQHSMACDSGCEISNVGFFDGAVKAPAKSLLFKNSEIYSRNVDSVSFLRLFELPEGPEISN
jgi:hypothetical protein